MIDFGRPQDELNGLLLVIAIDASLQSYGITASCLLDMDSGSY